MNICVLELLEKIMVLYKTSDDPRPGDVKIDLKDLKGLEWLDATNQIYKDVYKDWSNVMVERTGIDRSPFPFINTTTGEIFGNAVWGDEQSPIPDQYSNIISGWQLRGNSNAEVNVITNSDNHLYTSQSPLPSPSPQPGACQWRQTGGGRKSGLRESTNDKDCNVKVSWGASGFCDCTGTNSGDFNSCQSNECKGRDSNKNFENRNTSDTQATKSCSEVCTR